MKIGNIDLGDKPLFLAPMEDVTDASFRYICKEFGADMMYTEFVSSDGLIGMPGNPLPNWLHLIMKNLSGYRYMDIFLKQWLRLHKWLRMLRGLQVVPVRILLI